MNVDLIINKVTIENLSKSETIQQITDAGDLLPLFKGEDKQKLETFKQRLEDHLAVVNQQQYDMSTIQPTAYSGINTGEETDTNQDVMVHYGKQYDVKPESKLLKYGGWLGALGATVLALLKSGQTKAAEAKFNEAAARLQGNQQALGELQNLYNDVNTAYAASQQTIQQTGAVGNNFVMRDSQSGVDATTRNLARKQFRAQQFEKFNHKYEGMIQKLNEEISTLKGTNGDVEKLLAQKAMELKQCHLKPDDSVRWIQLLSDKLGMKATTVCSIMGGALGLGAGIALSQLSRYLSSGRRYNSSYERKMNTVFGSKQDGYIPGQDSILFMEDKEIQPNFTQYIPFITPSYKDADGAITGTKGATVSSQQVANYMKPLHNEGITKDWADEHIRGMVAQDDSSQEISEIQNVQQQPAGQLTGAQAFGGKQIGAKQFKNGVSDDIKNQMYDLVRQKGYYKSSQQWYDNGGTSGQANAVGDLLASSDKFKQYFQ